MRPFQNRIKYFEMRIVGPCFLSSRPLPVLPPCVWAEEPGGHPWHPYRAPLAKSPNRSVPRAPHPSEGSPSCLPTSQFFEKEPVSDQKQFEQREVLLSYGRDRELLQFHRWRLWKTGEKRLGEAGVGSWIPGVFLCSFCQMFTLVGHPHCPYHSALAPPGALLGAGPGSLGASIWRGGHGRVHRAWHASCESPAFSPAPPPLHPSRSAASQQRLPCRCSGSGSLS